MIIIPAEEFNHQARSGKGSSDKVYQNKPFNPSVIFAIKRKKVAINYCREWMKNNPPLICILVEDTHHIQVWYELLNNSILTQSQSRQTEPNLTAEKIYNSLLPSFKLPIDRGFILNCQQILTESIGPIAKIIIKKTVFENPKINREQFIKKLIQTLPQKLQKKDLEQQLNQLLND